ncbi:MAG TPA: phosphatase PAP2 family protein [Burkholderiales bacterium]|nr:phosphatase PAP2 family protein [Burkholderiales bacterium]
MPPRGRALTTAAWIRRLALRGSLAWLVLASFAVIALALFGFAEIADGIGPDEDLHLFDRRIAEALRAHVSEGVVAFFAVITGLGSGLAITVLGAAVSTALIAKRRLIELYAWILALAGSGLLNVTLKGWFMRDRPGDTPLLASWSFPSAHAMNGFVAYGMLVYLLARAARRGVLPAAVAVASAIVLLVGASRIVLGFHYFTDVIGGYAAGLAWLAVCVTFSEVALRRRRLISTDSGRSP